MNIPNLNGRHIHFIGCGGIGMLGLALMANEQGAIVTGSDIANGRNTSVLKSLGIKLFVGEHQTAHLPDKHKEYIVVYSSAIKADNPELSKATDDNIECFRRGAFLGLLSRSFETVISVAGSHGKTTVTSMLSHVFIKAGLNPGFYIGGFPNGWPKNASMGNGKLLITEADESDLSINELTPTIGIALNLDNDHAWNVGGLDKLLGGFNQYALSSEFFLNGSDNFPHGFLEDLQAKGINFLKKSDATKMPTNLSSLEKNNIITVVAVAEFFGINPEFAVSSLNDFPGVERRMTEVYKSKTLTVIEDYAHHPTEIEAVLSSARQKYPEYKIVIVFQPHREKRLQYCFNEFICKLKKADYVFVLPVYGAWENIGKRLDIELSEAIGADKSSNINSNWTGSAEIIAASIKNEKTLLMLLGAGDINCMINPLLSKLLKRPRYV